LQVGSGDAVRNTRGQFVKGASGNPSGRIPVPKDIKDALAPYTVEAAETLVKIMRGEISVTEASASGRAAEQIVSRVHGTPRQAVEVTGSGALTVQPVTPPMTPKEVTQYVRTLLTSEETALGLPPPTKGMSDAERMRRIASSGKLVSPDMYTAIHGEASEDEY
jgi:hypothetical protein